MFVNLYMHGVRSIYTCTLYIYIYNYIQLFKQLCKHVYIIVYNCI